MAFIDFQKAYDSVNRNILRSVLFQSGIQGNMLRTLKGIYSAFQACVMSKSDVSGFFESFQGLKQGCVAIKAQHFFSLLINGLANENIGQAKRGTPLGPTEIELIILLFADDLTRLASTVIGLQNQLNALSVAARKLGLTVIWINQRSVLCYNGFKQVWLFGCGNDIIFFN